MSRTRLNKSALTRERAKLQLYERILPSLDLKRRQLTLAVEQERRALEEQLAAGAAIESRIGDALPMLANPRMSLSGLVRITGVDIEQENFVGVRLPKLTGVAFEVAPYSLLSKPAWVDLLVERLREAAEHALRIQVGQDRLEKLEHARRRTTQRVNLFERRLIPEARRTIQRIRIVIGDLERDAVVRSKIAKAKHRPAQGAS
ncbi:MAG: V-type ATP synthase subunit D [Planctomycetota bacterium]